jgi:hypothetical protein
MIPPATGRKALLRRKKIRVKTDDGGEEKKIIN